MTHRVHTDLAARSRRGRALLAGGAVLGLGAVATLAAWTDDVWVLSTFTTSPFNVEAQVNPDDEDWEELDTVDDSGALAFHVEPTAMLPSDSVYAPLNLRIERGTSGGTVSLPSPPSTETPLGGSDQNFFEALEVTLFEVEPALCSEAGTENADPIDDFDEEPLSQAAGSDLVMLPQPVEGSAGEAVGICFKVTLPAGAGPGVAGGNTGPLIWNLKAEPVE